MNKFSLFKISIILLLLASAKVFADTPVYSNILWNDTSCYKEYAEGRSILFSHTDRYLVWAIESQAIFRDPETGDTMKIFYNNDSSYVCPMFNADDSKFYAIGPTSHYVSLYDSKTFMLIDTVAYLPDYPFTQFFLSPDGKTLTTYRDAQIFSWNLTADRKPDYSPNYSFQQSAIYYGNLLGDAVPGIDGMDYTPEGNILVKFKKTFSGSSSGSGYYNVEYRTIFQFFKLFNPQLDSIGLGKYYVPFVYSAAADIIASYYSDAFDDNLSVYFEDESGSNGSMPIVPELPDFKADHLRIFNASNNKALSTIYPPYAWYGGRDMFVYVRPLFSPDGKVVIAPLINYTISNFYDISDPEAPSLLFQINVRSENLRGIDFKAAISHNGKYYAILDGNGITVHQMDWKNWQQHTASVNDKNIASCSIFPNPASDNSRLEINLNSPEFLTIELFNAAGTKINTIAEKYFAVGKNQISIDARELSSGAYFVKINGKFSNITQKFLIKK